MPRREASCRGSNGGPSHPRSRARATSCRAFARISPTGSTGCPCSSTSARTDRWPQTRFPVRRILRLLVFIALGGSPYDVVEEGPVPRPDTARTELGQRSGNVLWDWFPPPPLLVQELLEPWRKSIRNTPGCSCA